MKKLRVYWLPQVPCSPFYREVKTLEEARAVLDTLGDYDLFLLKNNHRADYSNAGGLQYWDGKEMEWFDWCDEETGDSIDQYFERKERENG